MKALVTFALIISSATIALAAGDLAAAQEPTPFAAFITNTLQPLVLSLVSALVAAIIAKLSSVIKTHYGLEISAQTQGMINSYACEAVQYVEEKAAAYAKSNGEKWLAEQKHAEAISYLLGKFPALTKEEADAKIQSALLMIQGLGARRELGA